MSGVGNPHTPAIVLGPCPCDECPTAVKCATRGLCCMSFVMFVEGHGAEVWSRSEREPCRTQYLRLYEDSPDNAMSDAERALIDAKGNIHDAANALGVAYHTLRRELIRLGVST